MTTHYDVLGLERTATSSEIRAAYVRLIKEAHPDVNPELEDSTDRAIQIVEAYAVLRDKKARADYDQNIDNNRVGKRRPETEREEPKGARSFSRPVWMDSSEKHVCASCKREDVVLNQYSFAWVASLIFETRHGQDTFVLCSHCRVKKSLIYTARVMILGWWAVPIGVSLTVLAIIQDVFGGKTSRDESASVLAVHGYRLFTLGLYQEAFESFRLSQELVQTRDKGNFVERLRRLTLPLTPTESFFHQLSEANPAWMVIPLLATVICMGVRGSTAAVDYYRQQTTPQVVDTSVIPNSDLVRLRSEAARVHFNFDRFNQDRESCETVVKAAAIYMHNNVPIIGTHKEGNTIVSDYSFGQENLSADVLTGYQQTLSGDLSDAISVVKIMHSEKSPNSASGDLAQFISTELNFMRSCYFNISILEISVRHNNSPDSLSQASETAQQLNTLGNDPLLGNWIIQSGEGRHFATVTHRIAEEEQAQSIKSSINALQLTSDQLQQQITDLQHTMDSAKSSGDMDSYNVLVPNYNSDLTRANATDTAINTKVNVYNEIARELNNNPIDDAFDSCINANILLNRFDFVDLKSKYAKMQ